MPVLLRVEPADFIIDREALQHLDPSMNPLTDADSSSTFLRKGKGAFQYVRRQLSDILFGDDIPHPQLQSKYIGFYWKRHIVTREPSIAVVKLMSESQPVDNFLIFHAVEDVDEEHRAAVFHDTFVSEDRMEAWKAETQAQTQAQTQA
ncbi:hypothetical protein C7999DRAFT_44993 [Corynascus novoguineensis]|uniref:Uncharacterized protein n=1 Tax=Corynascus novoguineensis TaxID=1126955 RepID=A0AAN7CJ97_9PEZI|nr:hypothetical protein C7999DRAFT_44993 [Corynascus novoguineensis]